MPDVFTRKKRSEVMSRIRSRGNKRTELRMVALLRSLRWSGWRRHAPLRAPEIARKPSRRSGKDVDSTRVAEEGAVYGPSADVCSKAPEVPGRSQVIRPDFVFSKLKLAVFVDGCFWHGCPRCYVRPKGNRKFWDTKRETNQARDRRQSRLLEAAGWRVLRIWEHELTRRNESRLIARLRRIRG